MRSRNRPVIQTDDYYPFGLTFNSYKRVTAKENKYLFNGIERQTELDLGWDLAEFRSYSPEIGRWHQIDPKASERESPYVGFANNPIFFVDPLGDTVRVYANNEDGEQFLYAQVNTTHVNEDVNIDGTYDNTDYQTQVVDLDAKLESLAESLNATLEELDAYVIDLGAGFSFGGGATVGLELVYFTNGEDKGLHLFGYGGGTIGYEVGAGIEFGAATFNEDSGITPGVQSYEGLSQGGSVGLGRVSGTYSFSTEGNSLAPWTDSPKTWQTITVGAGVSVAKVGANWFWVKNKHLKKF